MHTYCVTKLLFLEQNDTEANEISGDDKLQGETNETSDDDDDDDDDNIEIEYSEISDEYFEGIHNNSKHNFISTYRT